jgi:hypothetical protein
MREGPRNVAVSHAHDSQRPDDVRAQAASLILRLGVSE